MKNFQTLRNIFDITQEELAKNLSIDLHTISSYESGRHLPSFKTLKKIINFYGISFDYLILLNDCHYPRNFKLLKLAKTLDNVSFSDSRSYIEGTIKTFLGAKLNVATDIKQDFINIELTDNFHKNLKEIRNLRSLTQPELSSKLGITRTLLSQYELRIYPPIERLIEISKALDVSVHSLAMGEKLTFDFEDRIFGKTMLIADQYLLPDDQKMLIRLMEATINNTNKNLIYA